MPTLERLLFGLLLVGAGAGGATEPVIGLGEALTEADLARYDITVFPDGRNLPPGRGSVTEGRVIYRDRCAACHGESGIEGPATRLAGSDGLFGWDDPLRIIRIKKYPLLIWSMGARWPYATSIFDYVRRAMPHTAPKSLSNDEVYAVTAYLLRMNALVEESAVMDRQALPKVKMPALDRSVSAWP
jgi:cytochrome c